MILPFCTSRILPGFMMRALCFNKSFLTNCVVERMSSMMAKKNECDDWFMLTREMPEIWYIHSVCVVSHVVTIWPCQIR